MRLLQDYLRAQAEKRPDQEAIVFRGAGTTYASLDQSSNRLAHALKQVGCRRGDRVALLLPKSAEALIAMFATLKADCIYVPIDCSSPVARISKIIEACEPRCILGVQVTAGTLGEIVETFPMPIGWMDAGFPVPGEVSFHSSDLLSFPDSRLDSTNGPNDAAHILFTSGSTGTPKGVVISHANVMAFVDWAIRYFDIQPEDRISGHPPLHFDLSTFDIYGTVAAGAQIHLLPQELSVLPHRLAHFIRDAKLTQWFSVPSVLQHMMNFGVIKHDDFPHLRRLLWCGEKFATPALIYWMERLPHVSFTNLYGPTEATIASSYYHVPSCPTEDTAEIPIGRPCEGEQLYVLDTDLKPCPADVIGDLYIGGAGLSSGYWRDEKKTADAFVSSPFGRIYRTGDLARLGRDGMIYLLGRSDMQIKSRGYRIELGEIEAALHALDGVQDAAVIAIDTGGFEGLAICCAYVSAQALSPLSIRKELERNLPHYMIPTQWLLLDSLPLNGNGKTARPRLKQMFLDRTTAPSMASAPGVRA
jgi:amino acid adenylation domain-containing protein